MHLPGTGLAGGVLHDMSAANYGDQPAAFGFLCAWIASALKTRTGPAVLITTRRALADLGQPYGPGLRQLGLDTSRLLIVETRNDKDAFWAAEEALRSEARPSVIAGVTSREIGLTASRRLNLAAAEFNTPLVSLHGPGPPELNAAATRWRIAAAAPVRDRFGALTDWRWHVTLERCRNGRPGAWLIEWCHVTHRFRLAESMADRSPVAGAGLLRAV